MSRQPQLLIIAVSLLIVSARSDQLLTSLLEYVESWHARVIILDVTGDLIFDQSVAHTIINIALAARLLGAQTIFCGIRPDLAETMISQDLRLDSMIVSANLHSAIARALKHTVLLTASRPMYEARTPPR